MICATDGLPRARMKPISNMCSHVHHARIEVDLCDKVTLTTSVIDPSLDYLITKLQQIHSSLICCFALLTRIRTMVGKKKTLTESFFFVLVKRLAPRYFLTDLRKSGKKSYPLFFFCLSPVIIINWGKLFHHVKLLRILFILEVNSAAWKTLVRHFNYFAAS